MGIRWTEQSWICSAAATSHSLSICSRAGECPFGEQSRGCEHSVEMRRLRFVFRVVPVNFLQLVVEIILQVLAPLL